jgi:copper(I)-binding protein
MRTLLFALFIAGMTLTPHASHAAPQASLTQNASIRASKAYSYPSLGMDRPGIAFVTLHNTTNQPVRLIAADAAEICASVEIHTHSAVDGVMQMRKLEDVTLEAGETLEFDQSNLHFMLMSMKKELAIGDYTRLEKEFPIAKRGEV